MGRSMRLKKDRKRRQQNLHSRERSRTHRRCPGDALFNELEVGGPRLLFKGGTSLSKGYGLIERFSEHVDITVFREDILWDKIVILLGLRRWWDHCGELRRGGKRVSRHYNAVCMNAVSMAPPDHTQNSGKLNCRGHTPP